MLIKSFEEYRDAWTRSVEDPEKFWDEIAGHFFWDKRWEKVLRWNFETPSVEWFIGGRCNITSNCLDRHLLERGRQTALVWEPNDPNAAVRKLSYEELHREVCRFANVLKQHGIQKGDRVCIYMPMIPEMAIAMLACARIGAVHSVVFGGFSSQSLAERINDCGCKLVITADGAFRGNKLIPLKETVDDALRHTPKVQTVIVFDHIHRQISMKADRDVWWHQQTEIAPDTCEAVPVDAEDPLFILYTSGSTGKPKGVVHTAGGYMVYTGYTFPNVFQYREGEVYWCTADIGWITGHSCTVYGPLLTGATMLIFEGIPNFPDAGRFWKTIEKHKVSIFYTAPTAIRSLMLEDISYTTQYDLSSLRVLATAGEPINQEAWEWYHTHIGKSRCPVVDTWWQTETGSVMISPIAGITPLKPTFAMFPMPGIQPILVDNEGKEITENDVEGNLCIRFPWPSIARTNWGDHERYRQNYFSTFKGLYFTGDGCKRDAEGHYRIIGRVDDIINVSGHRIGTAEVENAINEHEAVVESAIVGCPHDVKGQCIYAYVICHHPPEDEEKLRAEIRELVAKMIGSFAKPEKIQFVTGLPKTRSGKIMRRILRKIAEGQTGNLGDISTLLDPSVVDAIISERL